MLVVSVHLTDHLVSVLPLCSVQDYVLARLNNLCPSLSLKDARSRVRRKSICFGLGVAETLAS